MVCIGRKTAYWEEMESYIQANNLQNYIYFFHNIPMTTLPQFYKLATLLVYPSSFEGFGIPILEALVSGLPVITSEGSCFEEVGGENSIYINPKNIPSFSELLFKILMDSELRKKMKQQGRIYAKKFEAKRLTEEVEEVYQRLISA